MKLPGIEYVMWMVFQITGIAVWAMIVTVAIYFLVSRFLIGGVLASISFHRWVLRTDPKARITLDFAWSFALRVFEFCSVKPGKCVEYRSLNGGHWRSAFDYSYSGLDRSTQSGNLCKGAQPRDSN